MQAAEWSILSHLPRQRRSNSLEEMTLDNSTLSPDTEAILLLCGRFAHASGEQVPPLTQKEYEAITRWLLERKLRPADLLNADDVLFSDLVQARLDREKVSTLLRRGTALALALEKWHRSGLWVLSRSDAAYPRRLKKKLGQSAPPLLYGAGDMSILDNGGVAIVGSRDVSEAGLQFTQSLAQACVRDRLGVVSGGAKGVDLAAMQTCGEAGGIVIGVLAADLLRSCVNRQNRHGLQSGQLVLISPFNPEAGFSAGNAMARNRYIYALADFAVVVDSAQGEGGTWAGAIENLRHEWVPLYVRDADDKPGNRALISKGAKRFTYQFATRDSIRDYLDQNESRPRPEVCDLYVASMEQYLEAPPQVETNNSHELHTEDRSDRIEANQEVIATNVDGADSLDMLPVFLQRLPGLLGTTAKTEEEIRLALGLEKTQLKIWLAAAIESGIIEKLTRPVAYRLVVQGSLC